MILDHIVVSLVVSLIVAAALCACHLFTTRYLQGILNPTFDPFWIPRLLFPPAGFWRKYLWTFYYAAALVVPFARQAVFEDIPYDFRSKVSSRTIVVVVLYMFLTVLAAISVVVVGLYAVRNVIWVWSQFPETVPEWKPTPPPPPPM